MGKGKYPEQEEFEAGGELVDYGEEPEVETGASAVASRPGSRIAMMAVVLVIVVAGSYFAFFSGNKPKEDADVKTPKSTGALEKAVPVTPEAPATEQATSVPELPSPPPIQIPEPPPPPQVEQSIPMVAAPPPVVAPPPQIAPQPQPVAPVVSKENEEAERQRLLARRNSAIMLFGGGSGGGGSGGGGGSAKEGEEGEEGKEGAVKEGEGLAEKLLGKASDGGNLDPTEFTLKKTAAEQAKATLVGRDLGNIVAQGKIIDAVLETAINTDLPGQLRAIISRDVYAEQGKNIILPKGTRLVGSYQSDIKRGQRRVQVIWNRAIRPDGIDIALDSPGTDQLGRSGIEGIVDNKYFEIFSNAVLVTSISAGVAILASDAAGSGNITTTNNTDGSSTSTGNPEDFAIADGVRNVGDVTKQLLDDLTQMKPTITVDQGTRIKVFVNRDLIFPASVASGVRFVQ